MGSNDMGIKFTVFTKPWKMGLPELGQYVHGLGFDGVELPVRPGYQVEPEQVRRDLPRAAKILSDFGVRISTVAGPTDEATMEACAEAGVPIIRICVGAPVDHNFFSCNRRIPEGVGRIGSAPGSIWSLNRSAEPLQRLCREWIAATFRN